VASATVPLWLDRRRSDGEDFAINDDRSELLAEIAAEAKRALANRAAFVHAARQDRSLQATDT
jgi:hypothetical protein